MSQYVPKYLLKRIFPPNSLSNVDLDSDGTPDHWQIIMINVMMPISVADINAYGIDLEKVGQLFLNGTPLDSKKMIAFYEGKKYDYESFIKSTDLVIPLGARAKILYPWPNGLNVGKHKFSANFNIQQFNISGTIEIELELTEDRKCVQFSPNFD